MTTLAPSPEHASPGHASPARGVLWMLVTTFMFVAMDTLAKHLSQTYPVPQVVWARYLFHVLPLVILLGPRLPRVVRTERLGLQLLRSVFLLGATGMFFAALSFIPLADASAIMFVAPIVVTALSMPLLREHVGPRRWAGVVVGFLGAVVIIRPGTEAMHPAALFAVGAACCYALYQIATRVLSRTDAPLTTLVHSASVGAVITCAIVPFFWLAPAPLDWVMMAAMGMCGGLGHYTLIKAFHTAPAASIAPYGYSALIWATLFGFVVFADLPDAWTVVGAVIIAGSGLYIYHRERVRRAAA